jgi:hypothetical protein
MGSFEDRKTNCLLNINNLEFLSGEYQNRVKNLETLGSQRKTLEGKLQALRAKKQDILQSAETYAREFLDRSSTLKLPPPGLATLQDGILVAFFLAYVFVAIVLVHSTLKNGSSPPVVAFTLLTLFAAGILIAELIRRFA